VPASRRLLQAERSLGVPLTGLAVTWAYPSLYHSRLGTLGVSNQYFFSGYTKSTGTIKASLL
jgi:hypothetical protein